MQQGAIMNSEKENINTVNKDEHSDSSSKINTQQNQNSDKKQSDSQSDRGQQGTDASQPKFNKQSNLSDKDNKNYADKSDRA